MHRALVVLLTALLAGSTLAVPARAAAAGPRYVALGDSYAAGLGLTPLDASATGAACGRSTSNYPHRVAAALDLTLVDVTCSGAVIDDLEGSQRAGGSTVAPQFDALTADTRLVTLTVGGNDLGFSAIAQFCASLQGPDGPVRGDDQPGCTAHYDPGSDDTLAAKLRDQVAPALTTALTTIRQRAPQARIVVVDYPAIVPDSDHTPSGGCWTSPLQQSDSLPFTTADLPYLQTTQALLDQTLANAAAGAGAGVASVYTASLAHTACGDVPWVNGIRLDGFSVAPSSLHPNAAGVAALSAAAVPVARSLLSGASPTPAPSLISMSVSDGGLPSWLWIVTGVGALVVVLVLVGALRVARRRR